MLQIPRPLVYRQRRYAHKSLNKQELKDHSPFHVVPRFFDLYHPTTIWLINVIRNENEKELMRVLMDKQSKSLLKFEPDARAIQARHTVMNPPNKDFVITKAKYFQIIDRPEHYEKGDSRASLFSRHAVMYLTPLGVAIYMRKPKVARLLVECIDRDTNKKHILSRQPQFVSYVNDRFGDLMCMYDHNLAMLNESYDILTLMLANGNWFPMEPFQIVYRKRFVETYLKFDDFMDYAFYIIFTRRSSLNVPGLCSTLLKCPSEHFKQSYLCQPTRANKRTLLRDAEKIINNCKSYPRRLLRCAYYADKKMKSSLNLVLAAEIFVRTGMFKLIGEPALPFVAKGNRKRRLESMLPYRDRSRAIAVEWPNAMYEFDADCCIALLLGLVAKCHRLNKKPTFRTGLSLAVYLLAETGWLNYFDSISDLEFKDYFMGLDDAEKVVFQAEAFGFVRECARITVIDRNYDLVNFFNDSKLEAIGTTHDVRDPSVITQMLMCNDDNITRYVTLDVGESLKAASSIISGGRCRGEGRDNPRNKYYMNKLGFPPESVHTMMTNAANVDDDLATSSSTTGETEKEEEQQSSSSTVNSSNDSREQEVGRFAKTAELVLPDSAEPAERQQQQHQQQQHQQQQQQQQQRRRRRRQ